MVIKDILDSMEALNKLNNAHGMSSVVAFRIGKNIKAIEGEVKVFDDVRTKLLEEFANKDENGKPIIDKDTNQYNVPADKLEALEKAAQMAGQQMYQQQANQGGQDNTTHTNDDVVDGEFTEKH